MEDHNIIEKANGNRATDAERSLRGVLADSGYVDAKTALVEAQRQAVELKLARDRGDLVSREEAEREYLAAAGALLTKLENVTRLTRAKFPRTPPEVLAYVDRLIREAREEVAGDADGRQ